LRPFEFTATKELQARRGKTIAAKKKQARRAQEKRAAAQKFRAKEVPWKVKVKLLDTIIAEENKVREARIHARAKELKELAALPPRMQMWADTIGKKKKLVAAQAADNNVTTRQSRRRQAAIREAKALQRLHDEEQDGVPTHQLFRFKEFAMTKRAAAAAAAAAAPGSGSTALVEAKEGAVSKEQRVIKANPIRYLGQSPPAPPPTTAKWEQQKQKTKEMLALRTLEERRLQAEALERKEKLKPMKKRLAPFIRARKSKCDERTRESLRASRDSAKLRASQFAEQQEEMLKRVQARPLLLEIDNHDEGRLQARRRALLAIKDSLLRSGVTDFKRFFDPEELDDLEIE
jgi:hypothetical protein